jgi:hypothetical protein
MWDTANPVNRDYRVITAGWGCLGLLANLTAMNARIACHRLITKLAVDLLEGEDSSAQKGRTYRVWAWAAVVERRRAAGMEWYVKTRGVQFVRPPSDQRSACTKWDTHQANLSTLRHSKTGTVSVSMTAPVSMRGPVSVPKRPPVPFSEIPSFKHLESNESNTPSSLVTPIIATAIANEIGFIDEDALTRIVRKCRDIAGDATDEEIAELGAFQAHRIARLHNVENPVGLLIDLVPKCFVGEPFAHYRRDKIERAKRLQELYNEAEQVPDIKSKDR